ncbi:MAG: substrate-binding domain-containing protein [Oscillospiraceae bacterium]|nr:substrate-binding domain-containing protein [Oscillospiraceae bacterium]
MKKAIALLLALVMVLALAACGTTSGSTTQTTAAAETTTAGSKTEATTAAAATDLSSLTVGVFYYNYGDTYISSVRAALDKQLDKLGLNYQDYDGNNNQTTQNEQIQTALTTGCNLLIVNQVTSGSSDASKNIIGIAGDVPVIFFNRAIEEDGSEGSVLGAYDNICFVGTDAPEAGHLQGKMIGDYVMAHYDDIDLNGDGTISYAMFKGDEANVEAIYRTQYGVEDANAILTAAGKPALAYFDSNNSSCYQVDLQGSWSAQAALDYMNTDLSQYNEANGNMIELIICNNDNMAEGCISALEAAGFNNGTGKTIPVFGVDATDSAKELIAAGKMTGTVKQDAEGMAAAIASVLSMHADGKTMAESVAETAKTNTEMYSVADGVANKLFVAYAMYTGE